jgi:CRP-like cAMP-binding protein
MQSNKSIQQIHINQLLQMFKTHTSFSDKLQKEASELFKHKRLKKDAYFLQADKQATTIGFIISGAIREYYIDIKGNEYNKAFCFENDFTGSYYDLIRQQKSTVCIQTITDCDLLIANFAGFQQLAACNMEWLTIAHAIVTNLLLKKCEREHQLLTLTASERYYLLKQQHPLLEKLVPHYHIASYLGITPISLSRIRHNKQ